jgi:ankyrin repeat protein
VIDRPTDYTAKETLQALLSESFPHPQSLLASICMTHITECGFQNTTIRSEEQFRAALEKDPLLAYASQAWHLHASAGIDEEETMHRTAQFIKECQAFPAFTSFEHTFYFDILAALHIIALYKLPPALIQDSNSNITTALQQQTPLIIACRSGHRQLVDRLVALSGLHVNMADANGWLGLMRASLAGHLDIVKVLLAHPEIQVNLVNKDRCSALLLAAHNGHDGTVALLLAHLEIQVNLVDKNGWSALLLAARNGHDDTVALLLAHLEIQVNLVNKNGWSALLLAAQHGHDGTVTLLLAHPEIQVNLVNKKGSSALLLATRYGHDGTVKALLATGAVDVNAFDSDKDTPIKLAAQYGHEVVVSLLLDTPSIDITIRSKADDHNAMSVARANGHDGIVRLLQEFESRNARVMSTVDFNLLSVNDTPEELGSDSDPLESYFDAEDDWEEASGAASHVP